LTADVLRLHVEDSGLPPGAGVDTYVLIHGYAGSVFTWRHWAPRLALRGHVVLVDLKGFGRSPKPADGAYGPAHQADLVTRLIQDRDMVGLTIMGHSLGGGVTLLTALSLAAEGRHRLARMVLLSSAAYAQRLPPFVKLADHPRLSAFLFKALGPRRIVRSVLRSIVYDPSGVDEKQVRGYADPLDSSWAVGALIQSARQIRPHDLDDLAARYPTLDVPTLLMWGRQDRVVPLSVGERLARELPDARLHVFEECGHLPAEELPEPSWKVLEAFLDDTPAR
jgi:pimeloyl-ACP methyl ester carboxylesterase